MTAPTAYEALARLVELDDQAPTGFEIGTDPQWTNDWYQAMHQARQALAPEVAIPGEQWHEDDGPVLWWRFPIVEPPIFTHPQRLRLARLPHPLHPAAARPGGANLHT